jgi:hypothetical protein
MVDAWLMDEQPPTVGATAQSFSRWPEARRRAWLAFRFRAYQDCALGPRLFR